jgi:hypothetical protein
MSSGGWVPHPKGDERRRSAVNVARLALSAEDILPEHRHWLLSVAVWKYTEADGKWNPRFRSRAALGVTDKRRLNHEHVFPRRWLRERMLAEPDRYREIMAMAVACLVTRDEHLRVEPVRGGGHRGRRPGRRRPDHPGPRSGTRR